MKTMIVVACLFFAGHLLAQTLPEPLSIGDTLPNTKMGKIINSDKKIPFSSSLKNKLVILDFMSPFCSGCIHALPEMQALQDKYEGRVQFILVMTEAAPLVQKFLTRYKASQKFTIPVIVEDTILDAYFKHTTISHEAWLDGNGVVKAITQLEYVNDQNIATLLEGKPIDWPVKWEMENYNIDTPILTASQQPTGPLYYTAFTGYRKGILKTDKMFEDSTNQQRRWYVINAPLKILYNLALKYMPQIFFMQNRFICEVKEPGKIAYTPTAGYRDAFQRKNSWCYETTLPLAVTEKEMRAKLLNDLNNLLPYEAKIETRLTDCWLLENAVMGNDTLSAAAFDSRQNDFQAHEDDQLNAIACWANGFNSNPARLPMIDLTTYNRNVKLEFSEEMLADTETLKKELLKRGFKLTRAKRELPFFVVRDKVESPVK